MTQQYSSHTLDQIMAVAKSLCAVIYPDEEWEALHQCEVDVLRHLAERLLAVAERASKKRNVELEALEYIFGKGIDWKRVVDEKLVPPLPTEKRLNDMGLRASTDHEANVQATLTFWFWPPSTPRKLKPPHDT